MNKKGFTLTELLVVVVILGIIAGMAIPLKRNMRIIKTVYYQLLNYM